jgi:hypothetical protein
MDDFGVANADYFQQMYRDIYSEETGIRLVSNKGEPKPGRLVECKLLEMLIFLDSEGVVHVTLYDKREDYNFFINRLPNIDLNACKFQSISSFYGEIVRLFHLNTHSNGFFENITDVAFTPSSTLSPNSTWGTWKQRQKRRLHLQRRAHLPKHLQGAKLRILIPIELKFHTVVFLSLHCLLDLVSHRL